MQKYGLDCRPEIWKYCQRNVQVNLPDPLKLHKTRKKGKDHESLHSPLELAENDARQSAERGAASAEFVSKQNEVI